MVGWGSNEIRSFEAAAAADIGSNLEGEHKRVSVKSELNGILGGLTGDLRKVVLRASHFSTAELPLFCEPERSRRGRVRRLEIRLEDFTLANLRVEELSAEIPESRYDLGLAMKSRKIRLSRSGSGTGRVRLLAKDLADFILKKFREIKSVEVKLDRNRAYVSGYGEFLVVKTSFEVIAKLVPSEGNKILLAEAKVFLGGLIADEAVRDVLLQTLNPIVDLDQDLKLYGAVQLEGLSLENDVLKAWGKVKIPNRPSPNGGDLLEFVRDLDPAVGLDRKAVGHA
jgi:hypothetical protein